MNLPNKLTSARFVMAIVFVVLTSMPYLAVHAAAYILFAAAAITDYYDGKLARKYDLITNFGKLLDPVADKVLVVAAFIMLMENPYLAVPGWSIVMILAREFLVTGARLLAASEGIVIAADRSGKTKTFLQMGYAFWFLPLGIIARGLDSVGDLAVRYPEAVDVTQHIIRSTSWWLIVFVTGYTIYSGLEFARANWKALNIEDMLWARYPLHAP
jgi:CDP-diacylglycerol--glycerol-3-phosphate 3-phosphatidyltransferase